MSICHFLTFSFYRAMHFVENNPVTYNRRPVQQYGEREFMPKPNVFVSK